MNDRLLAPAVLAVVVVTVAVAVNSLRQSVPQATAQATYTLQAVVSPSGCGTVTAREASDTSTPTAGTSWTFARDSNIRIEATAAAGCTFVPGASSSGRTTSSPPAATPRTSS